MAAMIDDVKHAGDTPSFRVSPDLHGGFTGWKWPKHHTGPMVKPTDRQGQAFSGKEGYCEEDCQEGQGGQQEDRQAEDPEVGR